MNWSREQIKTLRKCNVLVIRWRLWRDTLSPPPSPQPAPSIMRCRPVTTPRPLASSLARFSSAAAMLAALAMAGSTTSKAATLQWDPNGNTDAGATGGTGTWDNVATNLSWFDG